MQLSYSYSTVWSQELIDSRSFHNLVPDAGLGNIPKRLINPEDFGGLNPHEEIIVDQFKVGGFVFDKEFITNYIIGGDNNNIVQIRNLQ